MRIALMVIRLFWIAPYYLLRIWWCGISSKISFEESFQFIKKVTKRANQAGRVTIETYGIENIPSEDGFIFFPIIRGCLMYLCFWIPALGHLLLLQRKKPVILFY